MFVVVGHESEEVIFVGDVRVEHGPIPIDHFLEAGGAQHRVGEFGRSDLLCRADVLGLCRH